MTIKPELLDELLAGCKTTGDVDTLYSQLLQRMINRSLAAEMTAHIGYGHGEKGQGEKGGRCCFIAFGGTKGDVAALLH